MAIIIPYKDYSGVMHEKAFIRNEVLNSKTLIGGARIILIIYSSYSAFKAGASPVRSSSSLDPLSIFIPFGTDCYKNYFSSSASLIENKSDVVCSYDFLKTIDGTEEGVKIRKNDYEDVDEYVLDNNGAPLIDDEGKPITETKSVRKVEFVLEQLLGIDFSSMISSFTQDEINAGALNGLPEKEDGKVFFNESTELMQKWINGGWVNIT